jgi:hypothetical protein
LALAACTDDPAARLLGVDVHARSEEIAAAPITSPGLDLSCAPAALRVPQGSTTTVACSLSMPSNVSASLTVASNRFPSGIRLHLVGADSTNTLAAGTTTTIFLAADVDSVVPTGQYTGALTVKGPNGPMQRISYALEVTPSSARVRMVYLIPSDRTYDADVAWGIERAARHLQIWYQQQLGAGGTFTLHWPVVDVVYSKRPSSYFAADAFYGVGDEVRRALKDKGKGPANIYAVYFDVVPTSATGGLTGLATLPHNDVVGIVGGDPVYGIPRWVGGLGHELGHALGLPHPPGCDDGIYTNDCNSLMYWGYFNYPSTFLAESQKPLLIASGYVQAVVTTSPVLFDAAAWGPTLVPEPATATASVAALPGDISSAAALLRRDRGVLASSASNRP